MLVMIKCLPVFSLILIYFALKAEDESHHCKCLCLRCSRFLRQSASVNTNIHNDTNTCACTLVASL